MRKCCILHCRSTSKKKGQDISFHRIPKNCDKGMWAKVCGNATSHTVICSRHFEEKYIDRFGDVARLINGAVPTLFMEENESDRNLKSVALDHTYVAILPDIVEKSVDSKCFLKMQLILNEPNTAAMSSNTDNCVLMEVVENHTIITDKLVPQSGHNDETDVSTHTSINEKETPDKIEKMDVDSLNSIDNASLLNDIKPKVDDVMVFFGDSISKPAANDNTVQESITSSSNNIFENNGMDSEHNTLNITMDENSIPIKNSSSCENITHLDTNNHSNETCQNNDTVPIQIIETSQDNSTVPIQIIETYQDNATVPNQIIETSHDNVIAKSSTDENESSKAHEKNNCELVQDRQETLENGTPMKDVNTNTGFTDLIIKTDIENQSSQNDISTCIKIEKDSILTEVPDATIPKIENITNDNDHNSEVSCDIEKDFTASKINPLKTEIGSEDVPQPEPLTEIHSPMDVDENTEIKDINDKPSGISNKSDSSFELLLSDDEVSEADKDNSNVAVDNKNKESECVSLDDDDDIVLISDGDLGKKNEKSKDNITDTTSTNDGSNETKEVTTSNKETGTDTTHVDTTRIETEKNNVPSRDYMDMLVCPLKIMRKLKPSLEEMTREDLEEFCVVKIVESISGRSAISDLQLKIKSHEKSMEEWRKKVISLNKQNKDLQIVLKTVCEEQQKRVKGNPMPIKITRSVGLQVGYPAIKSSSPPSGIINPGNSKPADPVNSKPADPVNSKPTDPVQPTLPAVTPVIKRGRPKAQTSTPISQPSTTSSKPTSKKGAPVPVPRLVPTPTVNTPTPKPQPPAITKTPNPSASTIPSSPLTNNGNMLKSALSQPVLDVPKSSTEKRSAIQSIDLTDDEPPAKQAALKPSPKLVQSNTRPPAPQQTNNPNRLTYVMNTSQNTVGPRPVYISISNQPQSNPILVSRKPTPTKVSIPPLRPFLGTSQAIRFGQPIPIRAPGIQMQHPAPLPQSINPKNQMHPGWKWIPPRPTLKIARVDNGIVISWEMDDFSDSQHEPIASYQIFAYQEASTNPTSDLWKKIGDVKALPLPMACTLTHFMPGYKYYFAVRALDIRSRVGPFSAPGQITLVNNKK